MFKVALIANDDHPIPDWVPERMAAAGIDYVYHDCRSRDDLRQYASDADCLWLMSSRKGLVVEENMDLFSRVVAAVKCGSGTDNIDRGACSKRGIIIGHTPDDATEPTSDHCIAMLMTAVRRTAAQDRLVRSGTWDAKRSLPIGRLTGADVGLIGFGRIGRAVVRKLSGFAMNFRVYDPYVDTADVESAGARRVDLDELLRSSQYVLVVCPLTKETYGLIGEEQLALMRRDSILVNTARGGIIDEKALAAALKEHQIAAAALDVLEERPPIEDLLALHTVNFTPHMGGYPPDYPSTIYLNPVQVILDIAAHRLPKWVVNPEAIPNGVWKEFAK